MSRSCSFSCKLIWSVSIAANCSSSMSSAHCLAMLISLALLRACARSLRISSTCSSLSCDSRCTDLRFRA